MQPDPLREIRDIRRQISLECGNDPEKVFDYYVAHQEKMKATGKYKFVSKPVAGLPAGMATEQTDEPER
jgi:hypothetical protein